MWPSKRLQSSHIRNLQSYIWLTCAARKSLFFSFFFFFLNLEYIVWFIFGWKDFLFLSERETHSPTKLLAFLTSKNKKKQKLTKKTNKLQQKRNVALTLFLYIKKDDPFLHYLVMNENFCGVIIDVLLCVLTKLVFLPSQNIQYSSISTVLTSCNYLLCFDQSDITREKSHTECTFTLSYCTQKDKAT